MKFFFNASVKEFAARTIVHALSSVASLDHRLATHRIRLAPGLSFSFFGGIVTHDVHRFEQSIGGRPYLIEVSAVAKDRWRAHIVRLPGVPTALMPFYGTTPDEAAQHLSAWLARAYERASTAAGTV